MDGDNKDDGDELNNLNDQKNEEARTKETVLQQEDEELKALLNLQGQSETTTKKRKNSQNQQAAKAKENKKGSLKENVPIAGPSTSKTVTTSDNSQESCHTNKHQNKNLPNIKATDSTPSKIPIPKKSDTKENKKGSLKKNVPVAGPSTSKTVTTDNSQESCRTNKISENKKRSVEEKASVAGPSTSSTVSASDNAQEPCCTNNGNKSKKPPKNIKTVQSTPPQIPKDSDTKNSQSTKAEIISKDDQMKSQFATYKKRGGTGDHGKQYEYLMCAYLALKFSMNENVVNFEMTTNNKKCGDFDDIGLFITFSDKSSHTFYIQLKHSLMGGVVNEIMLVHGEGDYSLKKNFESFKKIQNRKDITFVLFTHRSSQLKYSNLLLTHKDISGKVRVKPYEAKNANHLLINTAEKSEGTCFQFELHQNQDNSEDVTEFFGKFCLFTNQINVTKCQSLVEETLKKLFSCNIDFVSFMHHWWRNNFVLTRHDVITKLAELALGPYIQAIHIKSENYPSEKTKIFKNAIEKFDMTLITECDNDKVKKMWTVLLDEIQLVAMSKAALKYGLSTRGIRNIDVMLPWEQSKVLWYLNKVPLIVKYEEEAKDRVLAAVKLLGTEEKKMKLILLGNHSKDEFNTTWKVFENLYDLQDEEELYKKIIETFKVSLQGRTSIGLEQLIQVNQEIAKDIKTKELFQMLEDELCIGKPQAVLPQVYIPRTITTWLLNIERVLDYYISSKNDLLVLICNEEMKNVIASKIISNSTSNIKNFSRTSSTFFHNRDKHSDEQKLVIKEFDDCFLQKPFSITQSSKTLLLSTNNNFTTKEFAMICKQNPELNIYLLQIIDEESCVMVSKKGNITRFKEMEYKQSSKKEIREDELFSIFKNSLNVVTGKPGIGKSTLLTFLSQQCPSDSWCVRINLIEFNSVFKEKLDHEAVLNQILKNSVKQVCDTIYLDKFKSSKKIYLLLDGLDEMDSDCIKQVLEFIKFISGTGVKVWVSSRENLRERLEREMYVVPIEIQELTEMDQRSYISERLFPNSSLDNKYSKDEVENIITEIFKSVSINYNAKRLLGIPLQLYIITEIFRQRRQATEFTEEFFVLSKIYRRFFEGKLEHHKAKLGIMNREAFDDNLDHDLKQYELPALRACLDDGTFNKLKLDETELEESRTFLEKFKNKGNKLGIISQVVDKGQKLQAIFCHQSFAEYFACRWLERNVDKHRLIKKEFFEDKYQNLRLIFDIMLAEDKPLHLATIYKSPDQVKKYIEQSNDKDKGGRSALHIICSYCKVAFRWDRRDEEETLHVMEILKLLLQNYNYSEKDSLFDWDWQGYALHSMTLLPFDIFLKIRKEKKIIINENLFKHFTDYELVDYCSCFGYSHLLTAIVKERENITNKMGLQLICQAVKKCVESKQEYFKNQYIETIKVLANAGCNINEKDSIGYTPLFYACQNIGSCILLETLLKHGADINAVSNRNQIVLHFASKHNNAKIIEFLINKGAQVNQADKNNWTPLHYACQYNYSLDVIEILLNNGADINAVTNTNQTVLHLASKENKPEIIEFLINKGPQVNQVNVDNWTPLHYACEYNTLDVIEILLNNGADINAVTNTNQTVLHLASSQNKPEIIEFLIHKGAQVNQVAKNNWTPLHRACTFNTRDVIEVLLNNGADINAVTNDNENVLHFVSRNKNPEIIEYLINKGAQVNQADKNNWTPLHYAYQYNYSLDVIEILLNNGADINAVTNTNQTVLHLASKGNKPEIIEFLINKGAQVNQADKNNWTPLHFACCLDTIRDVIEILLNNGADINAVTNENKNVLHFASRNKKAEIIEFLINKGTQVNQADKNNWTPLHFACQYNTRDVMEILLNNGADINAVTNQNETMLDLAKINENIDEDSYSQLQQLL